MLATAYWGHFSLVTSLRWIFHLGNFCSSHKLNRKFRPFTGPVLASGRNWSLGVLGSDRTRLISGPKSVLRPQNPGPKKFRRKSTYHVPKSEPVYMFGPAGHDPQNLLWEIESSQSRLELNSGGLSFKIFGPPLTNIHKKGVPRSPKFKSILYRRSVFALTILACIDFTYLIKVEILLQAIHHLIHFPNFWISLFQNFEEKFHCLEFSDF